MKSIYIITPYMSYALGRSGCRTLAGSCSDGIRILPISRKVISPLRGRRGKQGNKYILY